MVSFCHITFIDWLLLFILINLGLLWWYQRNGCLAACFGGKCTPSLNSNNKNHNVNHNVNPNINIYKESFGDPGQVMIPDAQNQRRLLDNMDRGLKVGFHQHFRPYLPELGWRRLYERMNNTVGGVGNLQDPYRLIKGVSTRNYLDVMNSLDNVYKYTNY